MLYFVLVSISFDNYRKIHPGILEEYDETSSEEELDYEDNTKPTTKQPGRVRRLVDYPAPN